MLSFPKKICDVPLKGSTWVTLGCQCHASLINHNSIQICYKSVFLTKFWFRLNHNRCLWLLNSNKLCISFTNNITNIIQILIFFKIINNITFLKTNLFKGIIEIIKKSTQKNHLFSSYICIYEMHQIEL